MIRVCIVYMVSLMMTVNTMALEMNVKVGPKVEEYIGRSYEEVKRELKGINNINILQHEGLVCDLFVKTAAISIDGIKVGDAIEKVKRIYPKDWVYEYENSSIVLKGTVSHFNVATEYIAYLQENGKVCEIQIGRTASFTGAPLPSSNKEAYEALKGTWVSHTGKVLEFNNQSLRDNIMDMLYDYQSYRIISPNEMNIYSYVGDTVHKSNLKFWIGKDTLYLFKVNTLGVPIKETIESFTRKDTHN